MTEAVEKATRRSEAEWTALMTAYEASDLSQREFCQVNEVAYSTFGYWRKRLREVAPEATQAVEPLLDISSLVRDAPTPWRVELDLGDGMRLRLR